MIGLSEATSLEDILSALLVFFAGGLVIWHIAPRFNLTRLSGIIIYCWHTIYALAYQEYVIQNGGDALLYYHLGRVDSAPFGIGTAFVYFVTSFLARDASLSFLGASLGFSIFGAVGLVVFAGCLITLTPDKTSRLRFASWIIILLPSVSFWSSGIGKDGLAFLAVALATWAALDLNRRIALLFLATALMALVRPHIAAVLILSLGISTACESKITLSKRLLFGSVAFGFAATLAPTVLELTGFGQSVDVQSAVEFVERRQGFNNEGGGGIEISTMSLPMQLFSYLFRPHIGEATNISSAAAGVENLILLILFIGGVGASVGYHTRPRQNSSVFMFLYATGTWILLAMTTANLGIALRQKWMVAPVLVVLLVSSLNRSRGAR